MGTAKVLVLDDEKNITILTRAALSMHGYDVSESNNPIEALEVTKEKSFDLIMVDIMMPGMDGVTFIRNARETENNRGARFAILTGKQLKPDEEREIFDMGVEIIKKPFVPAKLVRTIDEIMRK